MATATRRTVKPVEETDVSSLFSDDAFTPYSIEFTVRGVRQFFFNAPSVDAYEKADGDRKAGVKRDHSKKDFESMVWRVDDVLAVPGQEFVKAMADMARGFPDPTKSGAKSMRAVLPTALGAHETLCTFFTLDGKGQEVPYGTWDNIDKRLGRLGRTMAPIRRPILEPGWMVRVTIDCLWPEVFAPADVSKLFERGGMRGVGDATRIGYGRYLVVGNESPVEISWT